ncbi:laminin subunit alpha-3-like [Glandiceps talaboti]
MAAGTGCSFYFTCSIWMCNLTPKRWTFVFLLLLFVPSTWTQISDTCEEPSLDGGFIYSPCIPKPVLVQFLEPQIIIEPENSTCGYGESEADNKFCDDDLVQNCYFCNASIPEEAHPPELMIDNEDDLPSHTWWQSVKWSDFTAPLYINVTLSFNKTFILADDIDLTFMSGRPQQLMLSKSTDFGLTWEVYQYYAQDCTIDFGMPSKLVSDITSVMEVFCTSAYSGYLPHTKGIVQFQVNERLNKLYLDTVGDTSDTDKFYAEYESEEMQNYIHFTDLRLSLMYPATDGLEFAHQTSNYYYYAISNIGMTLRCECNLHARICNITVDNSIVCDCQHNTAGKDCTECLPLYNNRPWQRGSYLPIADGGSANECEKCNCNDHADSCYYDDTLGHGVCVDCYHNTAGSFCDICIPSYYRNITDSPSSSDVCVLCDCEPLGTVPTTDNMTICSQYANTHLNQPVGQCPCVPNVQGRSCDECVDYYYGLLQVESPGVCKACQCNLLGTVNASNVCEKEEGQCPCKPNTYTRDCSQCKDESYLFPTNENNDCLLCGCDYGGSVSFVCNKVSGLCDCRPNVNGQRCKQVDEGFYYTFLDSNSYDAWEAQTNCEQWSSLPVDYTGVGYLRCTEGQYVQFDNVMAFSQKSDGLNFRPVLRYSYNSTENWFVAALSISVTGNTLQQDKLQEFVDSMDVTVQPSDNATTAQPPTIQTLCTQPIAVIQTFTVPFSPGEGVSWTPSTGGGLNIDRRCNYRARLELTSAGLASKDVIIDSFILMPVLSDYQVFQRGDAEQQLLYDECISNFSSIATLQDVYQDRSCQELSFSVSTEMNNGGISCSCNVSAGATSEICLAYGGQCPCKTGTYGQTCDRCQPGYYNFTSEGCTPCNCDMTGSESEVCDFETGQCTCKSGVAKDGETDFFGGLAGLQCQTCMSAYYGFDSGNGCTACDCSIDGSSSLQCDNSGTCSCKDTIGTQKCNECLPGYYSFSADGCTECACSEAGSVAGTCAAVDGVCNCKTNVIGAKCDQCASQTYNLLASNPDGCQRCYCFLHSSDCTHADNYVPAKITSDFTSNRFDGWSATIPGAIGATSAGIVVPIISVAETVYLTAPDKYLGFKLSSYAQYLTFAVHIVSGGFSAVSNFSVVIDGRNFSKSIIFNGDSFTLSTASQTFEVLLHESQWKDVETDSTSLLQDFQGILSDISSIKIRATFEPSVLVIFTNVKMDSVEPIADAPNGTVFATSVEDCACPSSSHVDGPSCTDCEMGYKRATPVTGPYSICIPCECPPIDPNDQNPPTLQRATECDRDTGICLDCSSGSQGDFCETCKTNVKTPDCDRCITDYYGFGTDLFDGGCEPCNCNTTGTGGATQCENDSGQCPCIGNYGGLQCEKCADNYYNWTEGCILCPDCYNVINEEMTTLGTLVTNLTDFVNYLVSQDNSTELGAFHIRLQDAYDEMMMLVDSIDTTVKEELDVGETIQSLNNSMQALLKILLTTAYGVNVSEANIDQATENVAVSIDAIDTTEQKLTDAHVMLTSGDLEQAQIQLRALQIDLIELEEQIISATGTTSGDVTALETQVEEMNTKTTDARQEADTALMSAQEAQLTHDDTTKRVASLITTSTVLSISSDNIKMQADDVLNRAQGASTDASAALQQASSPNDNANVNVNALASSSLVKIAQSGAIETQATVALANDLYIVDEVKDAGNITDVVLQDINETITDVNARHERATTASGLATSAEQLSSDTFSAAAAMLSTLQNFDSKVNEVKQTANTALSTVSAVEALSSSAKIEANAIQTGLRDSTSHAEAALNTANEAYTTAENQRMSIFEANDRAIELEAESDAALSDTNTLVESVKTINDTLVSPQQAVCEEHTSTLNTLDATVQQAADLANQGLSMTETTRQDLEKLTSDLGNIGTIDTSQLAGYQERINAARDKFTEANLVDAITALKTAVDEQEQWLVQTRTEIESLESQVDALASFRVTND